MTQTTTIKVLCVDDNEMVGQAIGLRLKKEQGIEWLGLLSRADTLSAEVERTNPDIVLLDLDMPGRSSYEALAELSHRFPQVRVIMFTAHVQSSLIQHAMDLGAWGFVSKNENGDALVAAIRKVAAGEVAMGQEAQTVYNRF